MAALGVENGDDDDENPLDDEDNLLDDEAAVVDERQSTNVQAEIGIDEVVVGKKEKKKVKVRRLPLHRLAIEDIFEVGKAKMIGIDLPATRHRAKQRRQRERVALHDNLRAFLDEMGSNFDNELARIDPAPVTELSPRRKLAEKIRSLK
jgi:hypothetical protein